MKNKINYLRLSITDRCNLNCIYCTPLQKEQFLSHDQVLRYEEMARIAAQFARLGITKLRITGGEPLIKKGLTDLVRLLRKIDRLEEISLTTNGVLLKNQAQQLKDAGLDRINISLDTLRKDRFLSLTGMDFFEDVYAGILKALEAGLHPVKCNVVIMNGFNDDEISDFIRLTFAYPVHVRFIELFHTNERSANLTGRMIPNTEVIKIITENFGKLEPVSGIKGSGPAENFKLNGAKGTAGFISHFSKNFCNACNRLRMDCAGRIAPCLFSGPVIDIGNMVKKGISDENLLSVLKEIFDVKSSYRKKEDVQPLIEMSSIGG